MRSGKRAQESNDGGLRGAMSALFRTGTREWTYGDQRAAVIFMGSESPTARLYLYSEMNLNGGY
jgi:hypothetical protein